MFKLILTTAFILTISTRGAIGGAAVKDNYADHNCPTKKDTLSNRIICTTVDKPAENKGGRKLLFKNFSNIELSKIPGGASTTFLIAFVVDADGSILGERVIQDEVGHVGAQAIKIIKTFKWTAAVCNGKKVASLYQMRWQVCLQ